MKALELETVTDEVSQVVLTILLFLTGLLFDRQQWGIADKKNIGEENGIRTVELS